MKKHSKLMIGLNNQKRFTVLEDGWIKDNFTGLDWGPSSTKRMEFNDAVKYCLENGGHLPTAHELHSLVDFTKEQPAIHSIFKDTKFDDWYWSGTKTAWRKTAAWCVSFNYGYVDFGYEDCNSYVRPVRASK